MSKRARGGMGAIPEAVKQPTPEAEAILVAQVADAIEAEAVADAADAATATARSERTPQQTTVSIVAERQDAAMLPSLEAEAILIAQVADAIEAEEVADAADAAAKTMPTPKLEPSDRVPTLPASPASNRERFRAAMMPSQVTCDLSSVSTEAGLRWSFMAIVIVVYPASQNPLRRHVLLSDGHGTVGVTVWNTHVNLFGFSSVGQMAHLTKVSITVHNNNRGLSLNKESSVTLSEGNGHFAHTWWHSFLKQPPMAAIHFHDSKENHIVNVAGILGSVHKELKSVRNESKDLLTLKIVDRTGVIMVRSWNHSDAQFAHFIDKPILLRRVRVTAFANVKIGELLDGTGTITQPSPFEGSADLEQFWRE